MQEGQELSDAEEGRTVTLEDGLYAGRPRLYADLCVWEDSSRKMSAYIGPLCRGVGWMDVGVGRYVCSDADFAEEIKYLKQKVDAGEAAHGMYDMAEA